MEKFSLWYNTLEIHITNPYVVLVIYFFLSLLGVWVYRNLFKPIILAFLAAISFTLMDLRSALTEKPIWKISVWKMPYRIVYRWAKWTLFGIPDKAVGSKYVWLGIFKWQKIGTLVNKD